MNQSFLSFEYDDRRIFIFDIPFDNEMKEALRLEYTLENCHRYKEKHLIAVCNDIQTRQVLIMAGKIEIKGKKYKVFGWISRDGKPMTRAEFQISKNAQDLRIQKQNRTRNEDESKKRFGRGRGLLANINNYDSFPDLDELNINDMIDSNNNSISNVIAPNDYVKRVEQLCPGYFSNNDMASVVDEKEKQLLAESIVNEFPELFREFTEDELKICSYPDMSLQDEVMRMTDELLTRECERARPKPRVALRMKFTDEEEELLGRNRPATMPCYEVPERPLPGTLVKPSELPCILSPAYLLDAKLRLEKKLKALDEEDRKMEENERRTTREEKQDKLKNSSQS